jgi:hypothetical protein
MNGTQPTPLSTDTNFSFGKRARIPLNSRSRMWAPLCRNRRLPPRAAAAEKVSISERSGPQSSPMSPLPMWKLIGSPASCAAAQTGSQRRSARNGRPKFCGSPVNSTPRCPSAAQRSISATVSATSQKGVAMTGISRRGSADTHSTRKSL